MKVVKWVEVEIPHGTSNAYKNYGCRCGPCSDAGSEWMRDYYRRTNGLTKMVRTGEPMVRGSQGGVNGGDGSVRGSQKNVTRRLTRAGKNPETGRKKPMVVDFEPDESD